MHASRCSNHRALALAAVLLLACTGCGGRLYPVHGTVVLDDGTPLTKGLVIFDGKSGDTVVTARGEVKPDGTYAMGTFKLGDGMPPGKYRVAISPMDLSELPDEKKNIPFDYKYMKIETSGLEYEVKADHNEFPIKLERSRRTARR